MPVRSDFAQQRFDAAVTSDGSRRRMNWMRVTIGAGATSAILYALQLLSPLRLNTDSIILLQIADNLVSGRGFTYHGAATHFPPGYPSLVAAFEWIGGTRAAVLVLFNLLCLAFALWGAHKLLKSELGVRAQRALWAVIVASFSYVIVKHSAIPLTDIPFMAAEIASLLALATYERTRGMIWLAAGVIAAACAVAIRTVGVTLAPAIFWAVCRSRLEAFTWSRRSRYLLLIGVAAGVLIGGMLVFRTKYAQEAIAVYRDIYGITGVVRTLVIRLTEAGELSLNVPSSRLAVVPPWVFAILGLPLWAALITALWRRRQQLRALDAFVVAYLLVLLLWPYADARLWIPLVPFVAGYLTTVCGRAAPLFVGWLSITGILALAYSTQLSLMSFRKFAQHYGTQERRPAYIAAANALPFQSTDSTLVDAYHLLLIWR